MSHYPRSTQYLSYVHQAHCNYYSSQQYPPKYRQQYRPTFRNSNYSQPSPTDFGRKYNYNTYQTNDYYQSHNSAPQSNENSSVNYINMKPNTSYNSTAYLTKNASVFKNSVSFPYAPFPPSPCHIISPAWNTTESNSKRNFKFQEIAKKISSPRRYILSIQN